MPQAVGQRGAFVTDHVGEPAGATDSKGDSASIHASDVNDYLQEICEDITAKDFRTWKASLTCFALLSRETPADSEAEQDREIVAAIKATAGNLHHRPATCRKYYVHPAIVKAYATGEPLEGASRCCADRSPRNGHSVMEERLISFLTDYG